MTFNYIMSHNTFMRKYKVIKREQPRKNKNGEIKTWVSSTFYISYYENRERVWIDTKLTDEEKAKEYAKTKMAAIECGTVYEYLKQHNWLDETKNPLYFDSNHGNINYHLNYAHSRKNVRYLQIILEDIKDPIGECLFESVSRKDVQSFKDRLAELKTYKDGHGCVREITQTFRNNVLSAFSTIWSYYLRTGKESIKANPFLQVEKFKKLTPVQKKYIFTPEDYKDLFDRDVLSSLDPISTYKSKHDGKEFKLPREKWDELINSVWIDFFEFVFLTGMRGSEAAAISVNSFVPNNDYRILNINKAFKAGLRKKDVNDNTRGVEIIGKTKTGEERKIVLCDRAREIALKYIEGKNGDDLLFTLPMKRGQNKYSTFLFSQKRANAFKLFINEMNAQYNFIDEENQDALSLHGARTSLNSVLLDKTNLRESLIAYVMGWTSHSLSDTQREHYTRYEIKDLCEVAKEINRLYLDKEFTWTPPSAERKVISRQTRKAEILRKGEKARWITELRETVEHYLLDLQERKKLDEQYYSRAYERSKRMGDEILSTSIDEQKQMTKDKLVPYANSFIGITRGSRYRDRFEDLARSYRDDWDES